MAFGSEMGVVWGWVCPIGAARPLSRQDTVSRTQNPSRKSNFIEWPTRVLLHNSLVLSVRQGAPQSSESSDPGRALVTALRSLACQGNTVHSPTQPSEQSNTSEVMSAPRHAPMTSLDEMESAGHLYTI